MKRVFNYYFHLNSFLTNNFIVDFQFLDWHHEVAEMSGHYLVFDPFSGCNVAKRNQN